jgi:hypothetical protein
MEENRSEDIGCDVVRIFDVDPRKQWPLKTNNIMLGGYPMLRMPFVQDDRSRPQSLEDGESPITWFLTSGSVRMQKNVLVYEILPFLMEQEATGSLSQWSTSTRKVIGSRTTAYGQLGRELGNCSYRKESSQEIGMKIRQKD